MLEVFVKSNSHIPIVSMYKHQINKTLEACKCYTLITNGQFAKFPN